MRGRTSAMPHTRCVAFTLIELLIVVSIIAILVAMAVPALRQTRRGAMGSVCISNMGQIYRAIYGTRGTATRRGLPEPASWVSAAGIGGASGVLVCPLDDPTDLYRSGENAFDDLVVIQWDHSGHPDDGYITSTQMTDIIDGENLPDPQISWFRNDAVHRGSQLKGEDDLKSKAGVGDWSELPDGVIAVSIDWSGRFLIDLNNYTITIYDKWQGDPNGGGSRHFIYDSEGEVCEIGGGRHTHTNGTAHQGYNPPFELQVGGSPVSYGMNGLIDPRRPRSGQIMLLDYEKALVELEADGTAIDDFDEQYAGRHGGRAHVMFVDNHIEMLAQAEAEVRAELWVQDPDDELLP